MEEPDMVKQLEEAAARSGRSVASEIRGAIRYRLSGYENQDE
jgi:hypothetical protein